MIIDSLNKVSVAQSTKEHQNQEVPSFVQTNTRQSYHTKSNQATRRPAPPNHPLVGRLIRDLLDRARHLDPVDRFLFEAVYQHGHSITALATARNTPRVNLARRLRKLRRHLSEPLVAATIRQLPHFPPHLRDTALHTVIRRHTIAATAKALNQTITQTRRLRDVVLTFAAF